MRITVRSVCLALGTTTLCALALTAPVMLGCDGTITTGGVQVGVVSALTFEKEKVQHRSDGDDVTSIIVKVTEIDARIGGTWIPVVTTPSVIDLLQLDHQNLTSLGITHLPTGNITELRLVLDPIGDYVGLKSGKKRPLEVPDNGIVKITGRLDLDSCASGTMILDFDPRLETEDEDESHEYELRAVATIKTEEIAGSCKADGGTPDGGGSCVGVVCPMGDICQMGACVHDPCQGVVCPTGKMCHSGSCI